MAHQLPVGKCQGTVLGLKRRDVIIKGGTVRSCFSCPCHMMNSLRCVWVFVYMVKPATDNRKGQCGPRLGKGPQLSKSPQLGKGPQLESVNKTNGSSCQKVQTIGGPWLLMFTRVLKLHTKCGPENINVGTWNTMWTYSCPCSVFTLNWNSLKNMQNKEMSTKWLQYRAVCVWHVRLRERERE